MVLLFAAACARASDGEVASNASDLGRVEASQAVADAGPSSPTPSTERRLPIVDALPEMPRIRCGPFDRLASSKVLPLLGGRLTLALPNRARVSPSFEETRPVPQLDPVTVLHLERGNATLFVMAHETQRAMPEDLATVIARLEGERVGEGIVVRTRLVGGFEAALVEPNTKDGDQDEVRIAIVYFETPEGTVASVSVYVTPNVTTDPARCRGVARAIFDRLIPGSARIDFTASTRAMQREFLIDVPADHVFVLEPGPDFDVYRIFTLAPLGGTEPNVLGVYVGNHSSYDEEGAPRRATLFGNPVTYFSSNEGGRVQLEAEAAHRNRRDSVHVFIDAADDAAAVALVRTASTLRYPMTATD